MANADRAREWLHAEDAEGEYGFEHLVTSLAALLDAAEERGRKSLTCPFCDCGPGCSSEYICEGCFQEKVAAAEERERERWVKKVNEIMPEVGIEPLSFYGGYRAACGELQAWDSNRQGGGE